MLWVLEWEGMKGSIGLHKMNFLSLTIYRETGGSQLMPPRDPCNHLFWPFFHIFLPQITFAFQAATKRLLNRKPSVDLCYASCKKWTFKWAIRINQVLKKIYRDFAGECEMRWRKETVDKATNTRVKGEFGVTRRSYFALSLFPFLAAIRTCFFFASCEDLKVQICMQ